MRTDSKQDNTYAIQCFLNDERKLSHELTPEEAKNFHVAAQHLQKYLYETFLRPLKKIYTGELYNADPNCEHELDERCISGIRCKHCNGWFCY